jgi:hypothetical protein
MNPWDTHTCDLGHGLHPVIIVSNRDRAGRKEFVEVLDCSSQRATRPASPTEVILDESDGMDCATLCKCDLIWSVPRERIQAKRGTVALERRRAIISTIIRSHGWTAL